MNERTYTDEDILMDAVNTIGGLRIPIEMYDEIGAPLARVRTNLDALLNEVRRQQQEKMQQEMQEAQETDETRTGEEANIVPLHAVEDEGPVAEEEICGAGE